MTSNLSTLNRKWILGAVLCLVVLFLLAFGLKVSAIEGNPLSLDEFLSYEVGEIEEFFYLKFTAKKTFAFVWEYGTGDYYCIPKYPNTMEKFIISCPDFITGTPDYNMIIKKENLGMFHEANDCEISEIYTAGQTYEVYLLNYNYNSPLTPETATIETMKSLLRKRETEPFIDENSVFTMRQEDNEILYEKELYLTFLPEIDIIYPASNSEMIGTFTMEIDYFRAIEYNQLLIGFEDWDIDDCPDFDEPDYQEKKDLYFNNQSPLYFSDYFYNATGTTFVEISNIETGNYNCNMCRLYNDITGSMSSRLCKGYIVKILDYIPPADLPDIVLPISNWTNYYTEHSERYPTSTPIFTSMAETFTPLILWVGNTILFFNNYFDPETAGNKGEEIGNAVRVARGYLESIDDFFGGLPISTIFIFYLITAIVVIVYRLVKGILTIIIP